MALTVKQLIEKLKKEDQSALVAWRDHDQSHDEVNAYVDKVDECHPDLLEVEKDRLEKEGASNIVVLRWL